VRRWAAEAVGTAIVVTVSGAATVSSAPLAPMAGPAVWAALLLAGGPGRHHNPVLTAAAWVTGRVRGDDLAALLAGQAAGSLIGGLLGAAVVRAAVSPVGHGAATSGDVALRHALLAEFAVAFVVALVALAAAAAGRGPGAPVGLVAGAAALVAAPWGAVLANPAVALAGAVSGALPPVVAVAAVPAQLAGGLLAALLLPADHGRPAGAGMRGPHRVPLPPRPRDPSEPLVPAL
jgi:glycerol uptake facilitator-like aquaporin